MPYLRLSVLICLLCLNACKTLTATNFTEQNKTAPKLLIDPSLLSFEPRQDFIDYHGFQACLHSTTTPENTQEYWLEPTLLWPRIIRGLNIHRENHPRLTAELNWYVKNPRYMKRVTERANRYAHFIVEQVENRQLPMELALLPIVESAFDPFAYSHGRASGIWQFIPGTGKMYGLDINWWYDGRRDIIASTTAALDYLEKLNSLYDGDWLLALAAYNSGQGTVNKAIRKNRKKGKKTDFWSLDLPRETRSYVPKLLALAEIVERPLRYDITLHPIPNTPYFEAIDVGSQIDLAQAAVMADTDIEEIYKLNPGFNRWATAPKGPHRLVVPIEKAAIFREQLAILPASERIHWQRYKVKTGDSLLLLAKRFKTDVSVLKEINKLSGNMIRAGQALMIPTASISHASYSYSASQRHAKILQQRKGKAGSQQHHHVVKNGESFWTIARKYGVKTREVAHWNGMAPKDTLKIGQKLNIWVSGKSKAKLPPQRKAVTKKLGYTVRSGDSLAKIASKFRVSINDIVSWNNVNPKKYLKPGQRLTLYVNIIH